MTTAWQVVPGDRRVAYSPVALDLRDDFAGGSVPDPVSLRLEFQSGADWIESDLTPRRNGRGVFVYTGLGRALDPAALPKFQVRVFVESRQSRPLYRATADAIEFTVPTYNDTVPPMLSPLVPEVVVMLPTAAYPFAAHVRTIRGRVLDNAGAPVADAIVEADGVERAMTDETGAYTLPLRWQAVNAVVQVDASHPRTGRAGQRMLPLPASLTANQDITVN